MVYTCQLMKEGNLLVSAVDGILVTLPEFIDDIAIIKYRVRAAVCLLCSRASSGHS